MENSLTLMAGIGLVWRIAVDMDGGYIPIAVLQAERIKVTLIV